MFFFVVTSSANLGCILVSDMDLTTSLDKCLTTSTQCSDIHQSWRGQDQAPRRSRRAYDGVACCSDLEPITSQYVSLTAYHGKKTWGCLSSQVFVLRQPRALCDLSPQKCCYFFSKKWKQQQSLGALHFSSLRYWRLKNLSATNPNGPKCLETRFVVHSRRENGFDCIFPFAAGMFIVDYFGSEVLPLEDFTLEESVGLVRARVFKETPVWIYPLWSNGGGGGGTETTSAHELFLCKSAN